MQPSEAFSDTYTVESPSRITFGPGTTSALSAFTETHDISSALLITDPGVRDAGVIEPALDALESAGVAAAIYDRVAPEPKLRMAEEAAHAALEGDHDLLVGIGGGSSLDTTKLASALTEHDRPVREMLGMGNVPGPGRPTVLLPTTAGTGSEVTHIGVFSDEQDDGVKKVVYSRHLFADLAIVDPRLTNTLPPQVAATTGMDALTHAVEAYVTRLRNPYTDGLARHAIELVGESLRPAVHQGDVNDEARHEMSLAASLAGQAFVNSGLGAVHALTYPLGMRLGLGHGAANAVLLPYVMAFNAPADADRFADIARWLGVDPAAGESTLDLAYRGVDAVFELLEDIDLPTAISEIADLTQDDFEEFADIAIEYSEHNIERNPRAMDREQIVQVFRDAY